MTHALIIHTIAGSPRSLRLTLPAFFAIPDIGDVLVRLARGTFVLADVTSALQALLVGGGERPQDAAAIVRRLRLADAQNAALGAALAISEGLSTPEGELEPDGGSSDEPFTLGTAYRTGFAIGLKPREVDQLTPWEFAQAVAGWNRAHGGEEKPTAPKQDEMAELFARYG
jgi:Phage tail tube protein, GTA-gp10